MQRSKKLPRRYQTLRVAQSHPRAMLRSFWMNASYRACAKGARILRAKNFFDCGITCCRLQRPINEERRDLQKIAALHRVLFSGRAWGALFSRCLFYCSSLSTDCGVEFAVASTLVPACVSICARVRFDVSVAKSASRMLDSADVTFSSAT
jgi:hypothetical protein